MSMETRLLAGLLLASVIAAVGHRVRSLSASGAAAAVALGAVAIAAGWGWGALLVGFFVLSSLLTRAGAATKQRRTEHIVGKGGPRDAAQVLANGGIFAAAAVGAALTQHPTWAAIGAGALAAAAADTWATELGTLAHGSPRSIVTGREVPVGTSGGVSAVGTMGAVAGAATMGALAWLAAWAPGVAAAAAVGGVAGATADSLLGATIQARRWCDRCSAATERIVHRCGDTTRFVGGLRWLDNDAVNLAATAVGALVAVALARFAGS